MSPSPRPRRPPLSDAVAVFAERGYQGTSLQHLLAAMALDQPAFGRLFTNKQGCFLAAYDSIVAVTYARLAASISGQAPWAARLAAALRSLLELVDANPAPARLVLVESQFAGPAALERYTATRKSFAPFMREGRQCSTAPEQLPPSIDSSLPAAVGFGLRRQLLCGAAARDLYPELLRFLLLPYLGETETATCLADSPPPAAGAGPGRPADADQS